LLNKAKVIIIITCYVLIIKNINSYAGWRGVVCLSGESHLVYLMHQNIKNK